jgi:beta-glucanase (GH16 family)
MRCREIVAAGILVLSTASPGAAANPPLIWSDEFDGRFLDHAKWTASDDCRGGGNGERQCYTPRADNVAVAGGVLRLTARRQRVTVPALPVRMGGGPHRLVTRGYSSGQVHTSGKASFRYGRIEVSARMPAGQGLWSAIWLLPEHDNYGPYPLSGEIDIAEGVNLGVGRRSEIHGATHHGVRLAANRQVGGRTSLADPTDFHVYALDWTPRRMIWSVDGRTYHSQRRRRPFDQRFYLILNLAVGGGWAERSGRGGVDTAALPADLLIDWVRIYGR